MICAAICRSVAFARGVNGKGGMPKSFGWKTTVHASCVRPRCSAWCSARFRRGHEDIEDHIGPDVLGRIRRVAGGGRKLEIIGRFTEVLPNNWKLYAENVRDTYHASLLHVFFATFRINRLSQGGGILVSPNGGSHVSSTLAPTQAVDKAYDGLRSVNESLRLSDPSLLDAVDEHGGDRIRQQIMTVFPTFVMQKTHNVMAVRHYLPRGQHETDLHWIYLGYAGDTPETTHAAAEAAQSRGTRRVRFDGGWLRRRLRGTRRRGGDGRVAAGNGRQRHGK